MKEVISIFCLKLERLASTGKQIIAETLFSKQVNTTVNFINKVVGCVIFTNTLEKTLVFSQVVEVVDDAILLESGEYLLLESGFKFILE
jgi:hypothetical protein